MSHHGSFVSQEEVHGSKFMTEDYFEARLKQAMEYQNNKIEELTKAMTTLQEIVVFYETTNKELKQRSEAQAILLKQADQRIRVETAKVTELKNKINSLEEAKSLLEDVKGFARKHVYASAFGWVAAGTLGFLTAPVLVGAAGAVGTTATIATATMQVGGGCLAAGGVALGVAAAKGL